MADIGKPLKHRRVIPLDLPEEEKKIEPAKTVPSVPVKVPA